MLSATESRGRVAAAAICEAFHVHHLTNLRYVITGIVLTVIMVVIISYRRDVFAGCEWGATIRWLHVLSGVMWIGLLWYLNFVQIPIC